MKQKKIIRKEVGDAQFNNITKLSKPIAAASIAQVHIAKIKSDNQFKEVAIKSHMQYGSTKNLTLFNILLWAIRK